MRSLGPREKFSPEPAKAHKKRTPVENAQGHLAFVKKGIADGIFRDGAAEALRDAESRLAKAIEAERSIGPKERKQDAPAAPLTAPTKLPPTVAPAEDIPAAPDSPPGPNDFNYKGKVKGLYRAIAANIRQQKEKK